TLTGQATIAGAAANCKPNPYRSHLGRGMPACLRVKVFRFDQANPRTPPTSTKEDWSVENKAASSNLTPLMKPKTAAQKKKVEERAKKAQKKK
ncbi:hypothetical protein BGZ72_002219, partial [Mortierella alpina]